MAWKQLQRLQFGRLPALALIAGVSCISSDLQAQTELAIPVSTTIAVPANASSSQGRRNEVGSFEIQLQALDDQTSAPVVTALAASNEGRFLAAAGDDHAIRIVDVKSGRTISTFAGHVDWIQCLVFSHESKTDSETAPILYSAGNDGRVLEWKYQYPVASREIVRMPFAVRTISLSSEKQLLAIGGFSQEILLWDLSNNTLRHRLRCDCGDQRCVRFSPDGERLLCGGREGEIRVWDTHSGDLISSYHQHRGRVRTAAFSVDGTKITSAGEDRQLVRFDVSSGETEWKRELGASKMMSMCLINDSMIAVAGADDSIRIFDALADDIVAELQGHWGTVAVMAPCGEFLASGSFDTTIRIWDLEVIAQQRAHAGRPVVYPSLKMDADLRIR